MDGTSVRANSAAIYPVSDLNWQVVGVGDFDGDGTADVLLSYTLMNDPPIIWLMNVRYSNNWITTPDTGWKIVGRRGFQRRW
jgi:hypothetical protein